MMKQKLNYYIYLLKTYFPPYPIRYAFPMVVLSCAFLWCTDHTPR
jgi:hypothetical protein